MRSKFVFRKNEQVQWCKIIRKSLSTYLKHSNDHNIFRFLNVISNP
jgi:hypothetical protein